MNKKGIFGYILFALVCIVINFVYAQFSHEVSSNYMTFMFLYPAVIGVFTTLMNYKKIKYVSDLFFCGILTLTIGSFLQGIFEIAGTSSEFQIVYLVAGIGLILIGLVTLVVYMIKK